MPDCRPSHHRRSATVRSACSGPQTRRARYRPRANPLSCLTRHVWLIRDTDRVQRGDLVAQSQAPKLEHNNTPKWHPGVATCRDIGQWHRVRSMFLFCNAAPMLIGMLESRRPHAAHGANLVHQQKPFCPVCKRRQRGGVRPRKRKIAIEQAIANEEPRLCRPAFDAGGIELGSLGGGPRQAKVALQHAASTVAGLHSIAASPSPGSSFDVSAPRSP